MITAENEIGNGAETARPNTVRPRKLSIDLRSLEIVAIHCLLMYSTPEARLWVESNCNRLERPCVLKWQQRLKQTTRYFVAHVKCCMIARISVRTVLKASNG